MTFQRSNQSTSRNSQNAEKTSIFASRPAVIQTQHSQLAPTAEEIEQQNFATTNNFSHQTKSRFNHDFSSVPVHSLSTPIQRLIQPQLTIGKAGDKYEQEADRVAADVVNRMHQPESEKVQRQEIEEDEELQAKPEIGSIQRQELPEDEDKLQMKPVVQRLADEGGMAATPDLEASIQQARGSGQPLAENVQKPMEQAFGFDFSRVKVHTNPHSDQLNQSIQAKAFTTGRDIFFRQGAYDPSSRGGQELIAHELTHVVQQTGSMMQHQQENNVKSVNFSTSSVDVIQQKLMSRSELEAAAGKGAKKIATTNYQHIVQLVEKYENIDPKDFDGRLDLLNKIDDYIKAWFNNSKARNKKLGQKNRLDKQLALNKLSASIRHEKNAIKIYRSKELDKKLMSRSELSPLAGKGAKKIATTNYQHIVQLVEKYENIDPKDFDGRLDLLNKIDDYIKAWDNNKKARNKKLGQQTEMDKKLALSKLGDSIRKEIRNINESRKTYEPPQLASEVLQAEWKKARASDNPDDKVKFMQMFNDNYADALTGELEFVQYLAQKIVYLKLEAGSEIHANVKSPQQSGSILAESAQEDANYSTNYQLVQRYVGDAGMVAMLMLPKDKDKTKTAIVAFRGTAASIDKLSKQYGEPTGVRTDTDWRGVAFNAYKQGMKEMEDFYNLASPYAMTTVTGHSLGGALAQRFYQHISNKFPNSNLRLATYQSAPIDEQTASNIGKTQKAKVTHVRGRGDVVPLAGSTHIKGETIKYKALGDVSKHLAIPLANDQIDKAKTPQDVLDLMNYSLDKVIEGGKIDKRETSDTNRIYSGGRRAIGIIATPINLGRDIYHGKLVATWKGGKKEVESIKNLEKETKEIKRELQISQYLELDDEEIDEDENSKKKIETASDKEELTSSDEDE